MKAKVRPSKFKKIAKSLRKAFVGINKNMAKAQGSRKSGQQ